MVKVTLNRPSIYEHGPVRLIAGANEISEEHVKLLRANPIVAKEIEAGVLSIEDGAAGKAAAKAAAKAEAEAKAKAEADAKAAAEAAAKAAGGA